MGVPRVEFGKKGTEFFYMDSIEETKVKVRLAIKVIGCRFQ